MAPTATPVIIGAWVAALAVGNWYGNYTKNKLRSHAREGKEAKLKKEWAAKEEAAYQRGIDFASGKSAEKTSENVESSGDRRQKGSDDILGWLDYVDELTEEDFYPVEY